MDSSPGQFSTLIGIWPYLLLGTAATTVLLKSIVHNQPPQTLISMLVCLFAIHWLPLYIDGLELIGTTSSAQTNASLQRMLNDVRPLLSVLPTLFELTVVAVNSLVLYCARTKPSMDV